MIMMPGKKQIINFRGLGPSNTVLLIYNFTLEINAQGGVMLNCPIFHSKGLHKVIHYVECSPLNIPEVWGFKDHSEWFESSGRQL